MDMTTQAAMLNLKCSGTDKQIYPGDTVILHDWGIRSSKNQLCVGQFQWDEHERKFTFNMNYQLGTVMDMPNVQVDSSYDLFRTTPRHLTDGEKSEFMGFLR